jgi:hypothetical protein
MAKPDFDAVFQTTLAEIERDAKKIGVPMMDLAEDVGISRANMSRWKSRSPATVRKVAELQAALAARQASARKRGP